jgi:predicted nucleic-acid-binding Zn-ribbon protein
MSSERCSKCGSRDIRTRRMTNPHAKVQISALRSTKPVYHVCVECGHLEIFIDDAESRRKIAEKWKP